MNIYKTVIKALASLGKDTINELGKTFVENYSYCQYMSYEDMREAMSYILEYFPHENIIEYDQSYVLFGQPYWKSVLKERSNHEIYIDEDSYNKNNSTVINHYNSTYDDCQECSCICENVPIFFIDVFYDFCLNSEVVKNFFRNGENRMDDKEITQKSNNLKTIAKNLVVNSDEYKKIIDNLYDVGLEEERIYNIFYEILKNIK